MILVAPDACGAADHKRMVLRHRAVDAWRHPVGWWVKHSGQVGLQLCWHAKDVRKHLSAVDSPPTDPPCGARALVHDAHHDAVREEVGEVPKACAHQLGKVVDVQRHPVFKVEQLGEQTAASNLEEGQGV